MASGPSAGAQALMRQIGGQAAAVPAGVYIKADGSVDGTATQRWNFGLSAGGLIVDGDASVPVDYRWYTDGFAQWIARRNETDGAFEFQWRDPTDGSFIDHVYTVDPATGILNFTQNFTIAGFDTLADIDASIIDLYSAVEVHSLLVAQTAHGFVNGNAIYKNGTDYAKADADALASAAIGVVSDASNPNLFVVVFGGTFSLTTTEWDAVLGTTGGMTPGTRYYLSSTAGNMTSVAPSTRRQRVIVALTATLALVCPDEPFDATGAGSSDAVTKTFTQTGHGLPFGLPVYWDGTQWVASDSDDAISMVEGFISEVVDANTIKVTLGGWVTGAAADWLARNADGTNLVAGQFYWLSTTAGKITAAQPTSGFAQCIGKAYSTTIFKVQIGPVIDLGSGTGTAKRVTRVTHNVSQNIAIPSGYKTILFNTVVTDPFSQWDAAGNRFICQVAGHYFCTFTNAGPSGGDGTPAFSVNGTANYNGTDMTDIFNSCTTRLIYLNVGDYVQAQIFITANRAVAAPTLEIVGPL